jgi:hypothetical protein
MNSMLSIAVNVAVSYNPSKLMHQKCLLSITISSAISATQASLAKG